MTVAQIYALMNTVTTEILGSSDIVNEDLSNVVDVGTQILGATSVDNYVKTLSDHIGKVIFVNRPYMGSAPSVMKDGWEYGSILEKISYTMPQATENESWNLTNGQSYDVNVFYKPVVSAKFFNNRITFEIPMSFTEMQVKSSFSNAVQLNAFISGIYSVIEKAMTVKLDALIMRTINNFTAATIYDATKGTAHAGNISTVRSINLLKLFNDSQPTGTTAVKASDCLIHPEFLRFCAIHLGLTIDHISKISTLFNMGKQERFTPSDMLHIIMLSDFDRAVSVYLQSDTFHKDLVSLPNHETVPYWQGSGETYSFDSVSTIHVNTSAGEVSQSGILAVMFDNDALAVTNMNRRNTSNYNAKAEFINQWFKVDAQYYNDYNENFVVFYVADAVA